MRPFIALQAAVMALLGFAGVFVQAAHGATALARYTGLMLATTAAATVLSYALGMRMNISAKRLVQAGFAVPAALLWWADGRPELLALTFGTFFGMTWGARHWLELHSLSDTERDGYAAHAIALAVGVALTTTLLVSALLALFNEARTPVYALFAALSAAGALWAGRRLPSAPPVALLAPLSVLRQSAYLACLPLLLFESGLLGIGLVLTATGAVRSLDSASHYGWAASAATLAGALALRALRNKRHSENRVGWMGAACCGVVAAAALLGASALWPALFVLYLLLQAAVNPFWAASEHVLNQRAMDFRASVGDRVAAREGTLGLFRVLTLWLFWVAAAGLDDHQRLIAGAALMGLAAALEYGLGRRWLAAQSATAAHASAP